MPQYSDYMVNYFNLNPAAAGSPGCLIAKLGYRAQWVGLEGAPQTAFFNVHSNFKKKRRMWINDKHAWGLKFENDATGVSGPINRTTMQGAYAYHKPIGNQLFMSVGVHAGIIQYQYKFDNIKLPETSPFDDPVTSGNTSNSALLYPDISPGVMVYNQRGYVGYTLKNMIRNRLRKVYGDAAMGRMVFHHYLTAGYRLGGEKSVFSFIPSVNIKVAGHLPPSFDLTFMGNYNNLIDLGIQYRYIDGINAIVNLKLKNLTIGYAYDYNLSAIKFGSGNGHEIIFGYRWCVNEYKDNVPKEHCPAYR